MCIRDREKEQVKSLISNMSHQLKTPLADIMMYEEILEDGSLPREEQEKFLGKMKKQSVKVEWILNSLFKMVKLEQNVIVFEAEGALIRRTLLDLSLIHISRQTDVQFLFSAITFIKLTVGQLQLLIIGMGYLTLLATIFFTLFLSSRLKSVSSTAITALVFCILPFFLNSFWNSGLGDWISAVLPSGGTGMGNSFLYALLDTRFLFIGEHAFWVPCVMAVAAAVNIVLFCVLTAETYCRRTI